MRRQSYFNRLDDRGKRYVYLLVCPDSKECYVGQSLSPRWRWRQHLIGQERTYAWIQSLSTPPAMIIVDSAEGLDAEGQALELEYAWRCVAALQGWRVIDVTDPFQYAWDSTIRQAHRLLPRWPFITPASK